MRYAILADVHANLHALEAVLAEASRADVDSYVCAGDLVGYGPQPNECVALIAGLETTCVAGNHDLIALGSLSEDRSSRLALNTLRWTREVLDDAARAYLAALPLRASAPGGVIVAHGSLEDPEEYVLQRAQAERELKRIEDEHPDARVLVLGHTHAAQAWAPDGRRAPSAPGTRLALAGAPRWLLNPGSVGQSRQRLPHARFMLLDVERQEATFHAVSYDRAGARRALRRNGLPAGSLHRPPTGPRSWARRLRWRARRLRARVMKRR